MVSLIDASMDKLENASAPFIPTVILHWTHFQTSSPYVFQNSCPSIIPPHSTAMIIFWRQILECFSSQVKTLKWVSFYLKLGSKSLLWPTQLRLSSLPTWEMDLPSRFPSTPHLGYLLPDSFLNTPHFLCIFVLCTPRFQSFSIWNLQNFLHIGMWGGGKRRHWCNIIFLICLSSLNIKLTFMENWKQWWWRSMTV